MRTEHNYLIVEDDITFAEELGRALREMNQQVQLAHTIPSALDAVRNNQFSRIILDLKVGTDSGLELLIQNPDLAVHSSVVVLTGFASIKNAVHAIKLGAINFAQKPVRLHELLRIFESPHAEAMIETPTLLEVEELHIKNVLEKEQGNVSHAAKTLGLHRRSLQRKMRRLFGEE